MRQNEGWVGGERHTGKNVRQKEKRDRDRERQKSQRDSERKSDSYSEREWGGESE